MNRVVARHAALNSGGDRLAATRFDRYLIVRQAM